MTDEGETVGGTEEADAGMAEGSAGMTAREVRDATLTLRRPTLVDRLRERVPLPPTAVPPDGLPFWAQLPLSSKLPMFEHPRDAFVFHRNKLGRGLWRTSLAVASDFRLDDPYMHEVDYSYEAVHDPALHRMFQAEEHRKNLLRGGFILPTDEAVCTLRQFNTYRRYLCTIYRDLVKEEYRKRAVDLTDEQTIRLARRCEEKQIERDARRVAREKKQGELRQHLAELRRQKQQELVARQLHYLELLERVEAKKEEERKLAVERARDLDERVKYRQALAAEIQRSKVIATIQSWNREEKERLARLQRQQLQLQEYKEKQVQRQWEAKLQCQREREERDARLLARQEEALRLAVELRNKKMECADLRMQAVLKKVKADRDKERARMFRFHPAKRRRSGRVGRARSGDRGDLKRRRRVDSSARVVDEMDPLDRTFNVTLRMVRAGREAGQSSVTGDDLWKMLRDTGFDPNETRDGVPEAVATAMDSLLDSVMEGVVHRMVMQTLQCVYHRVLERCFTLIEDLRSRERAQRGWACRHGASRNRALREKAKVQEERACREREGDPAATTSQEEGEDDQDDEGAAISRSPRKRRSQRLSSEEERQRVLRQIESLDRQNQQLKKALEQNDSSTASTSSEKVNRKDDLDLNANFEVMSKSLQKRMVTIARQSVNEDTRLTTQHRWKVLKEVELFELVDRLCTMMMTMTPRVFLKSAEFQWAADILARDVMREVRHQVRQSDRKKERARARRAREAGAAARLRTAPPRVVGSGHKTKRERETQASHVTTAADRGLQAGPSPSEPGIDRPAAGTGSSARTQQHSAAPLATEPLDESKVPMLRLHKRSPHQPSIPSLDSLT